MKKFLAGALMVSLMISVVGISTAGADEIPAVYPIQGFLTDDEGQPIDGEVDIRFRLYEGDDVHHQEIVAVQVSQGSFLHYLGEEETLDPEFFAQFSSLELGIKVGTDNEMSPRLKVGSVPFAARAAMADHAIHADSATSVDGSIPIYRVTNLFCEETPGTLMFTDKCYASQRNVNSCSNTCGTGETRRRNCAGDCICVSLFLCPIAIDTNPNPRCNTPRCDNTEVGQIVPLEQD